MLRNLQTFSENIEERRSCISLIQRGGLKCLQPKFVNCSSKDSFSEGPIKIPTIKVKKAVIPAAGLGTRFLPETKSIAKELLPIVDAPCIQYIVEEAVTSGITDIIIIVNDEKESIKNYFAHSKKLTEILKKKGLNKELKEIDRIEKMAKITFVKQDQALGDGHAILCAKKFIKNEPFAVLFGDDIYDSKIPPLAQMLKHYSKFNTPIIGLTKIDIKDSKKYGIIEKEKTVEKNLHKIKNLVEKPDPKNAPSNLGIVGKYIVTPELFEALIRTKPEKGKELRLIDGMRTFIKTNPIYGYEIQGTRFDTGDKLGLIKAIIHFALKHKDLKKPLGRYLGSL